MASRRPEPRRALGAPFRTMPCIVKVLVLSFSSCFLEAIFLVGEEILLVRVVSDSYSSSRPIEMPYQHQRDDVAPFGYEFQPLISV